MADEPYTTLRPYDALSPRGLAGKREHVLELERRGDADAIALLVECLGDESGYLRDLAAAALVRLGAAITPIVPLLASGLWYTRASAVRTLGRLADREAAAPLAPLISDSNQSVQLETVEALASIARAGNEVHVARALYSRGEAHYTRVLTDMRGRDAGLAGRIDGLLHDRDLMSAAEHELLPTRSDAREGDDGVAWAVLTGATEEPHLEAVGVETDRKSDLPPAPNGPAA